MFYRFLQTNPGGRFIVDDNLDRDVLIESNSHDEALNKAISIGIYFDGIIKGLDCRCCSNRWSSILEDYNIFKSKEDFMLRFHFPNMRFTDTICIIHYIDGTKERITYESYLRE